MNIPHSTFTIPHSDFDYTNRWLEHAPVEETLRWVVSEFGESAAVVTSLQITGIVTLHMLGQLGLRLPVLTIDTGLLFPETYALIDEVEARLGVEIQRVRPRQSVAEQAAEYGPALWTRQPDRCCHYRKVIPLRQALQPYSAWLTGVRRDQSATRTATPIVQWDERNQMVKIAPFACWTEAFVWEYIHAYDLPYNQLHNQHYTSIGCHPCTHAIDPAVTDKRAGRWAGTAKVECGLHVSS
jgi:phosphoadenosine phosphosulfate reductase